MDEQHWQTLCRAGTDCTAAILHWLLALGAVHSAVVDGLTIWYGAECSRGKVYRHTAATHVFVCCNETNHEMAHLLPIFLLAIVLLSQTS